MFRGRLPRGAGCTDSSSSARISDVSVNLFDLGLRDMNEGMPRKGGTNGPFVNKIVGAIMLIIVGTCGLWGIG